MSKLKAIRNPPRKTILKIKSLTETQIIEYTQAFRISDRDDDGLMGSKDLSYLIRSLEFNPSDEEIQHLIDSVMDEGSNLINCKQFLKIMSTLQKSQEYYNRTELYDIFCALDTDNNGLIDGMDLRGALRLLASNTEDLKLTREELDEMIAEVDGNKDGRITFEEFASIFAEQI